MSNYFSNFPTIQHDIGDTGNKIAVTNILRRYAIKSELSDNLGIYYDYDVQSGDRPDTISNKYYGTPSYAWVVLMFNEIQDPVFDWPLFNQDFDAYIEGKYGSVQSAQANVYEYRQILEQQRTLVDGTVIKQRYVVVDEDTYNTLADIDKELITKFDWELEQNEKKRKIKILDKRFLNQIAAEVEDILRNGV